MSGFELGGKNGSRQTTKHYSSEEPEGPRLSLRGLNGIFAKIRRRAGIEKIGAGFHASRRGRITELHRRGISGPTLTKEWGWKSNQTVTYIKLSKHEAEKAIQEAHPYWQETSHHVNKAKED